MRIARSYPDPTRGSGVEVIAAPVVCLLERELDPVLHRGSSRRGRGCCGGLAAFVQGLRWLDAGASGVAAPAIGGLGDGVGS
ncbi:MAG TPA: hypothetical protein VGM56_11935, partial [Byssovorax sp.]